METSNPDDLSNDDFSETSIFILMFSIINPESFLNLKNKWIVEIKKHYEGVPFIVVGSNSENRKDNEGDLKMIKFDEGVKFSNDVGGSFGYLEFIDLDSVLNILSFCVDLILKKIQI
jgi:GTPase SAR1 family protein